jgi:predicted SAM-dependent methyltransferase
MFRVLKPGGILNFSVPESLNLDSTNEWVIQDTSHDEHVRQYGADLADILQDAGFEVHLEESLLRKIRTEHLKHATYPMRIFRLSKPVVS